ncbi:MAG: glycosyltransferase family 4 protein [Candidatus Omnitrophica bacterium]|nr:glycosyltransferase family 4 protein [Candidatus Omnitrophota bacterium]MBU4478953.1 glycosyltransferase family 4 protein [Candidatus Omnitrophota bacterium]MCG2703904.1 glycosyltransferase family 4 protein [Candidatus Omnitrophota bacterium]
MKVLLLTTHLDYGGISSYTVSLADALAKRNHAVVCASSGGDLVGQLEKNGISPVYIPIKTKSELNPAILFSAAKLTHFVKKEKIDIIHAQTRVTQVLAQYLNNATRVPFVSTCHGFFRQNIGRQLFPCWGKKVIAISDAVKKHLMIDFYLPENKIALIPNGIDFSRFRISPKRYDVNYADRTVGIIARLSTVKGHKYLIEAMSQALKEFSDARLFIFGQGKIKYELIGLAEKLNIQDKVYFLPSVANPAEVLQEIDIFVMPSLQEGLGLSILEANACGIPVIASNVGGIPTIVKHDVTGLLVPPKEPSALAAAIMKVMENKELAMRLGKRAREEVEQRFSIPVMTEKVESVYKEVLGL